MKIVIEIQIIISHQGFSLHFTMTKQVCFHVNKWAETKTLVSLSSNIHSHHVLSVWFPYRRAVVERKQNGKWMCIWRQLTVTLWHAEKPRGPSLPVSTQVTSEKWIKLPVPQFPSLVKRERQSLPNFAQYPKQSVRSHNNNYEKKIHKYLKSSKVFWDGTWLFS